MTSVEHLQPANWTGIAGFALVAYLLGCVTSGYYLVRCRLGQDIRAIGSGSVGARNVGRFLGWRGFLLTLALDFGKGALAVGAVRALTQDERLVALSMLSVVVGHIWPIQLRLQGGKGMATSLGALCLFDFRLALWFVILFAASFLLTRRTVVSGLVALAALPFLAVVLAHENFVAGYTPVKVISIGAIAALVLIAHRKNILTEFWHCLETLKIRVRNDPPRL